MQQLTELHGGAWDALRAYHQVARSSVALWRAFFAQHFAGTHYETGEISQWIERVGMTFETLFQMHLYDTKHRLAIHPSGSGFPEQVHIRILEAAKAQHVPARDVRLLRRNFLDHLFQNERGNHWILEQIAKARGQQLILEHEVLSQFKVIRLQHLPVQNGANRYVCCFERYCYRMLPTLYVVMFTVSADALDAALTEELALVLREETSRLPKLAQLAQAIDQACAPIHPTWIGRITLGPLFIAGVTKDAHELQQVIDAAGSYASASRVISESIVSTGEAAVTRLFDPKGRQHQVLQQYAVRELDDECRERMVSSVEKYLFAPHAVLQMLGETFRRDINHRTITEEELR